MSTHTFFKFKNIVSKRVIEGKNRSHAFRKVLGKAVYEKFSDEATHNKLVEQAIKLTGVMPGRKQVDFHDYGHGLIQNNIKNGTGSYDVSLALYYLLLRLEDTPKYEYSSCVAIIDEYVFGKGNSFVQEFPKFLLPPIDNIEYPALSLSWALFIEKYAQFKDIDIELERPKRSGLLVTDIKTNTPVFDEVIEVNQGFRFHLYTPLAGIGLALQADGFKTYPLRFSRDKVLYESQAGKMIFPLQKEGDEEIFLFENEAQITQFIFIIANHSSGQVLIDYSKILKVGNEISSGTLDRFAHDLNSTNGLVEVRRIDVKFEHKV